MNEPAGLREYVASRSDALLRRAWLLTGDRASAQDLVQISLSRVWARWGHIDPGARDAYVLRTMTHAYLTSQRRWWSRETPTGEVPEPESMLTDMEANVADRLDLAPFSALVLG